MYFFSCEALGLTKMDSMSAYIGRTVYHINCRRSGNIVECVADGDSSRTGKKKREKKTNKKIQNERRPTFLSITSYPVRSLDWLLTSINVNYFVTL